MEMEGGGGGSKRNIGEFFRQTLKKKKERKIKFSFISKLL